MIHLRERHREETRARRRLVREGLLGGDNAAHVPVTDLVEGARAESVSLPSGFAQYFDDVPGAAAKPAGEMSELQRLHARRRLPSKRAAAKTAAAAVVPRDSLA